MNEDVRERGMALFATAAARFGAQPWAPRARFLAACVSPVAHELVHAAHQRLQMATAITGRKATGPEAKFYARDDPGDAQYTEGVALYLRVMEHAGRLFPDRQYTRACVADLVARCATRLEARGEGCATPGDADAAELPALRALLAICAGWLPALAEARGFCIAFMPRGPSSETQVSGVGFF